ncbi:MAG TPA: OmpA family protein [Parvibaculum sp.]|jgi:outer membrane protein OmpA-like peptidoglycan-associated protein
MTISFQRWAFASVGACALVLSLATAVGARAAEDDMPIDAVPLIRPMPMRGLQPSDEPLAPPAPEEAPQAAPDAAPATAAPAQSTSSAPIALPAPEAALMRVHFEPGDATLTPTAVSEIQSFAAGFKARAGRIGLKSYAGKPGETTSNARRLSLKRVLAVREQLLAQGISAQRLEVQALGGVRDAGPPDRVDVVKSGR